MSRSTVKAGVVGASGYTGSELVRLLSNHPSFQCTYATSRQYAGEPLSSIYPRLSGQVDLTLEEPEVDRMKSCDLLFLAVPHGTSMDLVPELDDGEQCIIDLAGDYRIQDVDLFEQYYETTHTDADRLAEFTYGLPEFFGEEIANSRLIANPGCYVTSVLLALLPLMERDWIQSPVFVDSKSGISGAGRNPSPSKLFMNVNNEIKPYKIGVHRHQAEMNYHLPGDPDLRFVPHVIAADRGIESAIYAQPVDGVTLDQVRDCYRNWTDQHPLLRYRSEPVGIKAVASTPFCDLSVAGDDQGLILISTLDNLLKGAASQAVQNANLLYDLPTETGLLN